MAKPVVVDIQGMHCQACVGRVDQALADLAGVDEVQVSVGQVRFRLDQTVCRVGEAVAAIRGLDGFEVVSFQVGRSA